MRHGVCAPFVMSLHFCGIVGDAECVTLKKRQHVGMSSVMHYLCLLHVSVYSTDHTFSKCRR